MDSGLETTRQTAEENADRRAWLKIGLVGTIVAGLTLAAAAAAFLWIEDERERAMLDWQSRLGVLAASRADAVSRWVEQQRDVVQSLDDNDALRLYVAEILSAEREGDSGRALAAREYAQTLLRTTAARNGYDAPPRGPDLPANVPRTPVAGMAIVTGELRPLVATGQMPAASEQIRALARRKFTEPGTTVSTLYPGSGGEPVSVSVVGAIREIQGENTIAAVIATKPAGDELFALLSQPGETYRTAEAVLVEADGNVIRYLSPLADGTPALGKALSLDTPGLASAFAVASPEDFSVRTDYAGTEVLVTGRRVAGTGWTLVYKVSRGEALGPTDARLTRTLLLLLAGVAIAAAGALALWRHGASVRAGAAARRYKELSERFGRQIRFTRALSDVEPNAAFVVDGQGRMTFANAPAAREAGGGTADDLVGKPLEAVFGPYRARLHGERIEEVRKGNARVVHLDRPDEGRDGGRDGGTDTHGPDGRTVRGTYVPLGDASADGKSVLVVQEDLTELLAAEERARRVQETIVKRLVWLIDSRDPGSASHSGLVADVTRAIAAMLGLDRSWVRSSVEAAWLLNIGKIFVPSDMLTRSNALSEDELSEVRSAIARGAEFVSGIEFDRPVGTIIRMAHAVDAGPAALRSDGSDATAVLCARIVSAANAFVAMNSPRAHRARLDVDAALAEMNRRDALYGADVLAALRHYVENRGGRARWSKQPA